MEGEGGWFCWVWEWHLRRDKGFGFHVVVSILLGDGMGWDGRGGADECFFFFSSSRRAEEGSGFECRQWQIHGKVV